MDGTVRHRLLPQAGGFDGLRAIPVRLKGPRATATHGPDVRDLKRDRHPLASPAALMRPNTATRSPASRKRPASEQFILHRCVPARAQVELIGETSPC
jgi:hypothetical protein